MGLPVLFLGFVVLVILGVPIAFVLGLASLVTIGATEGLPLALLVQRMFVGLNSFVLICVPLFMLAGDLMNNAGITDRLMKFSRALVGHIPGGLAHINVVVSMFFAGVSGSSTADTAYEGRIIIPAMVKEGYSKEVSVAVTACSSTLGVIIPPSIMMVIFGSVANVSIGGMFLGGVIPGILIGFGQMGIVYYQAIKHKYPKYPRASLKELLIAFAKSILALLTPLIVVGGIIFGIFTPTEAAGIASVYSLILGLFVYRTIKPKDLPRIFTANALLCSLTLFCVATATVFGWLLAYYNVPNAVAAFLTLFIKSPFLIFLLINIIFLIVGTFMDAIPAMVILVPLIYPIATKVGIDPIHLGVVVVINLAIGLITPPYGLCLLLACTIANISIPQSLRAVLPFFLVMVGILLLVTYVPDLILWLPKTIMPQFIK